MTVRLRGIGTAVPVGRVPQERALELALPLGADTDRKKRLFATLYRQSGVDFRHSVLVEGDGPSIRQSFYPPATSSSDRGPTTAERMARYALHAAPLAIASARRALDNGGVDAGTVTHLITVSCTGFVAPGVDAAMIQSLGLRPTTARTHVGFMGCHGALNGLRMARAIVESDACSRVLLTAVELCSLHQQYGWNRERLVANALFADGAASLIVDSRPDSDRPMVVRKTGAMLWPDAAGFMAWRIGDHGFEMQLSARVPEAIRANTRRWLEPWLAGAGLSLGQIGAWAVHPGGPKILTAVAQALELGDAALAPSRSVLSDFGNMSSPTVLFILERFLRERRPGPWVVLGFGPGLAIEAALLSAD